MPDAGFLQETTSLLRPYMGIRLRDRGRAPLGRAFRARIEHRIACEEVNVRASPLFFSRGRTVR